MAKPLKRSQSKQQAPRANQTGAPASVGRSERRGPAAVPAGGAERGRPPETTPGAQISRRAADRLRNGHLWVYASEIEALETGSRSGESTPPPLLPVADNRGLLLGTALYSPTSQIALRMVSHQAIGYDEWLALLEGRLRRSIERRFC